MFSALLTLVVGLILSINEKIHLFKRPITFARLSVIILLIISAILSFIMEITDDNRKALDSKTIITLGIKDNLLKERIDTLTKANKEDHKQYDDSLISYHNYTTTLLANYGLKIDTLNNTLNKFDTSSKKEIQPTLTILRPPIFDSLKGEKGMIYELNALNADGHILGYYYAIINIKSVAEFGDIRFGKIVNLLKISGKKLLV